MIAFAGVFIQVAIHDLGVFIFRKPWSRAKVLSFYFLKLISKVFMAVEIARLKKNGNSDGYRQNR